MNARIKEVSDGRVKGEWWIDSEIMSPFDIEISNVGGIEILLRLLQE